MIMPLRCRSAALAASITAALAGASFGSLGGLGSQAAAATTANPAVLATPAPTSVDPFLQGMQDLQDRGDDAGWDLAGARIADTDDRGSRVIVMTRDDSNLPNWKHPVGRQICVFATDVVWPASGGGGCGKVADFDREGVFGILTWFGEKPDEVFGVLPNGVETVTAKSASGQRVIRVVNNVVHFTRGAAYVLEFNGPSGVVRQPIAPGMTDSADAQTARRRHARGRHSHARRHAH